MTVAGGGFIYMTESCLPSNNPLQGRVMPYSHSGAPLFPTSKRPQEKKGKEKRQKKKTKGGGKEKRQPGPEAITFASR